MKTNYNISILVVDDDYVTRFIHRKLIESLNLSVFHFEANNGKDALDLIQTIGRSMPDIILLDINMPVMDGFEFVDEFRKLSGNEHTQIIIVSSSQSIVDINKALARGIDTVVSKPLSRSFLESIICDQLINAAA